MSNVEFRRFDTPEAVSVAVASHVLDMVRRQPAATLGLATGKTFVPIYAELVRQVGAQGISFATATSFNLDEYVGLERDHPASFRAYMVEHLFRHIDMPAEQGRLPDVEGDLNAACERFEAAIAAQGGIDLQLLGIGQNGHIGFNEPGSAFDSRTRVVELAQSTIDANTSDFPDGQTPPTQAVTMGIGTILEAREIVLVAIGANKANALHEAFCKPASTACPASALNSHPKVTVFCDAAAAKMLPAEGPAHT